jgi:tetratricopeptide (TPR) repeat protein
MNSRVPNSTAVSSSSSSKPGYSEMLYASSSSSKLMDIVVRLNNVGVACVESSEFADAKQCFERALARTNVTSPLSTRTPPSKFHQQQTGTTTEKPNKSELYVFQREEYDEGMSAFSDPVNIDTASRSDLSDNDIQATILYNVGQLCVKMGENEDALESFCLALKAL